MKSQELRERLEKAEANVEKRKATIERHKKAAEKKLQQIKAKGWEPDRALYQNNRGNESWEAYWAVCEYEHKLEDIKGATDKLAEAEEIAANWRAKLEKQVDLETKIAFEMPEVFRQLKDELAKSWTEYDLERKAMMLAFKKRYTDGEMTYKEWRKHYKYSEELSLSRSEAEFYKENEREAEIFIIDLYNRVKAITGEVTDWGNIHYGGKALNGWVEGKNGKAKVESILAGGYNIQRLHVRVLVHEIK